MERPLWKTGWPSLTKINILLPYVPAIMLLGIYTNELKPYVHTKPCTQMMIATAFIIVKTWRQLRCPSAGKWINDGILFSARNKYQTMKRHGATLDVYY